MLLFKYTHMYPEAMYSIIIYFNAVKCIHSFWVDVDDLFGNSFPTPKDIIERKKAEIYPHLSRPYKQLSWRFPGCLFPLGMPIRQHPHLCSGLSGAVLLHSGSWPVPMSCRIFAALYCQE